MSAFLNADALVRHFAPTLTFGDRVAAKLGARVETRAVKAVDGVSLTVNKGETLGLVGESGCGKSTLGRMLAGIMSPTAGTVTLDGAPVRTGGAKATTRVQTVFQDPFSSLDPRMRIADIIAEGPLVHGLATRAERDRLVSENLTRAGLPPAFGVRFPHQFSGGQRQRVAIARALAMAPDVLICDEPVASLDMSIQAQIINLFLDLKEELGLTMVFISHDLSVVRHLSDRVAIMYLGRIVEEGATEDVFAAPKHPYTAGLLASVPRLDLSGTAQPLAPIAGEIPSPLAPPAGCHFHPRCPRAIPRCGTETPVLRPVGAGLAACHLAAEEQAPAN
ncbi:MAG: oligopeptide/dipeptide ABC transporter ATP-binding protein [Pseudomonadota bacterium]